MFRLLPGICEIAALQCEVMARVSCPYIEAKSAAKSGRAVTSIGRKKKRRQAAALQTKAARRYEGLLMVFEEASQTATVLLK
jgi:hypothetical protein